MFLAKRRILSRLACCLFNPLLFQRIASGEMLVNVQYSTLFVMQDAHALVLYFDS